MAGVTATTATAGAATGRSRGPCVEDHEPLTPFLPSGVTRLNLGGDALFDQRRQTLHALNPTSAFLFDGLAKGCGPGELVRALSDTGVAVAAAEDWVRVSIAEWLDRGWIAPGGAAAQPAERVRADMGGAVFDLRVSGGVDRLAEAAPWLAAAIDAGEPSVRGPRLDLTFREGWLSVGVGKSVRTVPVETAAAPLKVAMTEAVRDFETDGFLLHAGVVDCGGGPILILGDPGAGKSTLCAHVVREGGRCGGDDIVQVFADGTVQGVAFPLTSKSDGWSLLAAEAAVARPEQRDDGRWVRYLPGLVSPLSANRPAGVLILDRQVDAACRVEPLDATALLTRLLADGHSPRGGVTPDLLLEIASMVETCAGGRLIYADASDAARFLMRGPPWIG